MKKDSEKEIWFRAKMYGWGWGLPLTWQGWVVYAIYTAFVAFGMINMDENVSIPYLIYFIIITVPLVWICYLKGEKPRWRWGKD